MGVALASSRSRVVVLLRAGAGALPPGGVLESAARPPAALELAEEGPHLGTVAPELAALDRRGPELVAFASPGCRLCLELEPALRALERDGLPVHSVNEDGPAAVFAGLPRARNALRRPSWSAGTAARGLVNTLEQIEELIEVGEERVGAPA